MTYRDKKTGKFISNKQYNEQNSTERTQSLNEKRTQSLNKNVFECVTCGKRWKSSSSLIEHLRSHTDDRPFACKYCNESFKLIGIKVRHIRRRHKNENPYECNYCDNNFETLKKLRVHVKSLHTCLYPFRCNYCKKEFRFLSVAENHLRTHNEGSFECTKCRRKFKYLEKFQLHSKNCKVYECKYCDKRFFKLRRLRCHLESTKCIRNKVKNEFGCDLQRTVKVTCWQCGKKFVNNENLYKHQEKHHPDVKENLVVPISPNFVCLYCSASFGNVYELDSHSKQYYTF